MNWMTDKLNQSEKVLHNYTVKEILLYVVCLTLSIFLGCAEPDGPVGSNVGDDRGGENLSKVFYADRDTSLSFSPPNTGYSQHLYVGLTNGISARTLIRFNRPSLPEEWTLLDSSRIELFYREGIGSGDYPDIIVSRIDFDWSESDTIASDTLPEREPLTVSEIPQSDSGRVLIYPGYDLILGLLDTTDTDSLTILIEAPEPLNKLMNFCSRTAVEETVAEDDTTGEEPHLVRPRLYIYISVLDTAEELDTMEVITTADADLFIIEYVTSVSSDTLLIGSGAVFRSFVHFDLIDTSLIDITKYYNVVNRAVLTLHRNPLDSLLPLTLALKPYGFSFIDTLKYRTVELINIVNAVTAVDSTSDSLEFTVGKAVENWLLGKHAIGWLTLLSAAEGKNIDRVGFYGSDADTALKPRLRVDYTRFKK